jgi:N-terminal acetyltransferase B complex non-catalytic subunit
MLRLVQLERSSNHRTAEDLLDACKQYISMRCEQLSCFDELRAALEGLDGKFQQEFGDYAQEIAKAKSESVPSSVIPILNALKLEYCIIVSSQMAPEVTRDFNCKVIDTYRQCCATKKDCGEPAAQLVMLACTALVQINQTQKRSMPDRNMSLLQAGFLLRYCLTRTTDNYPTLVVLTRISTLLGAISLSATFFKKLSIKNLQWENAGHLLLTRLSTLHPQRSNGDDGIFDPLQMLDLAKAVNDNSVGSVRRLIMVGLDNKSYVNVMDTISLREDLKRSFSKQMYYLEDARTQRLRNGSNSREESVLPGELWQIQNQLLAHYNAQVGTSVDRRDFSFISSFGHTSLKQFSEYLETGPKQKVCNSDASRVFKFS